MSSPVVSSATENLAAVLHRPGDIRIESRPVPAIAADEVLVAVSSVGVCGSDVHYFEHGRIGAFVVREPLILGHEVSGVVVDRGEQVRRHEVGDRVALEPGVPCGRCEACRRGAYNVCPHVRFFATPPVDGAFARFVSIHQDYAFALPPEISDEAGALLEPLSVGIWASRKAGVAPGDRVLVTGAGPIGNLAMQVARAAGATEVMLADLNRARLDRGAELGATATIDTREQPLDELAGFDALIECTGHPQVMSSGIRALRAGGTAVLVGMGPDEDASLPVAAIAARELHITATFRYANTWPTAIRMARAKEVDLDGMVDARFPLERTADALRATAEDPSLLKVVVSARP